MIKLKECSDKYWKCCHRDLNTDHCNYYNDDCDLLRAEELSMRKKAGKIFSMINRLLKQTKKIIEIWHTRNSYDKICVLCDGYWKLPEGPIKGYCFNRSNHWFPEKLKEKFICAECASFLLESLVGHSKNALYNQFEWIIKKEVK